MNTLFSLHISYKRVTKNNSPNDSTRVVARDCFQCRQWLALAHLIDDWSLFWCTSTLFHTLPHSSSLLLCVPQLSNHSLTPHSTPHLRCFLHFKEDFLSEGPNWHYKRADDNLTLELTAVGNQSKLSAHNISDTAYRLETWEHCKCVSHRISICINVFVICVANVRRFFGHISTQS